MKVNKTAVIHQAYFLPWLGYFNKLIYATDFVVLDNVQYNIRDYHNRTNIKSMHGRKIWITLSVGSNNYQVPCSAVKVVNKETLNNVFATIHHSYAKTRYYPKLWPMIQDAIMKGYPNLVDIDVNIIKIILSILNLTNVKVSLASEIGLFTDPTERLIKICKDLGCGRLIIGQGGSAECHNLCAINDAGIEYAIQEFYANHPIYPQVFGEFVSHLSTIDALFNVGPEETYSLIKNAWIPSWRNK
jgi:hypothetical protein